MKSEHNNTINTLESIEIPMDGSLCEQIRHALTTTIRLGKIAPPPAYIVEHIVGCDRCRGAIVLLFAAMLPDVPEPPHTACAACQADLAAFIDLQAQGFIVEAARIYPHVWWHLWVCPECAEEYELLQMLSAPEQDHVPVVHMPATPAHRRLGAITLKRPFLHSVLTSQPAAIGQARGKQDRPIMLAEVDHDDYHINLRVRRQADAQWCVLVSVMPPMIGWCVLRFDDNAFRARFDTKSESQFIDIPYAFLAGSDGPDLVVDIELDTPIGDNPARDDDS